MNIQGKTVLITGGVKGIGRATAIEFAKRGARVIVNYRADESSATGLMKEIESIGGGDSFAIRADISDQKQVDEMFAEIKQRGVELDVLINNAGIVDEKDSPFDTEIAERIFAVNFFGQIRVVAAARQIMETGKIIFISSVHGRIGNGRPAATAYSASKAALDSYMKNLAKDLAPDILVNAIAPGRTLTSLWDGTSDYDMTKLTEGTLIKRWIDPSEIATAAIFLAENDAMCGEILTVDGGMTLKTLG